MCNIEKSLKDLNSVTKEVRYEGIHCLMNIGCGSEAVIKGLLVVLSDECFLIRSRAAQAFAVRGQGNDEVIKRLGLLATSDEFWLVREDAVKALGEIGLGSTEAIQAVLVALSDAALTVRFQAARALGKIGQGGESVIKMLRVASKDHIGFVKEEAIDSLKKQMFIKSALGTFCSVFSA